MRGARKSRWWVRAPLAVVVMAFVGQLGGPVPAGSQKPVPAQGNAVAFVAFGLLTTAIGSIFLSGRRRRRFGAEGTGDATA